MSDKRLKILVGVNTLTVIDQTVYANHCQMWFRFGRSAVDIDFAFYTPRRASIDRMRNEVGKFAVQHEFDYILFIDDDVLVPFDGLMKLLKADADIAAGWTIIRGYPFDNMFFKYDTPEKVGLKRWNGWKETDLIEGTSILPVDAVGFSFCLIKTSLLHKVPPPYFVTGPFNTEDIYFCIKSRIQYPECTIVIDTSVKTGHLFGSEFIDPGNVEHFKNYIEAAYPDQVEQNPVSSDRGDNYLAMVEDPTEENKKKYLEKGH